MEETVMDDPRLELTVDTKPLDAMLTAVSLLAESGDVDHEVILNANPEYPSQWVRVEKRSGKMEMVLYPSDVFLDLLASAMPLESS